MDRAHARIAHLKAQLQPTAAAEEVLTAGASTKSPRDVVIVSALRTAIGRAKKGSFKDTHPTDLLAAVLQATVERTRINPALIGDIVVGNVLAPGGFAVQARMAQFMAGLPETVPLTTLNRQCSSGLQAVANVASAIQAGVIDIGIGAGVESMSTSDQAGAVGEINDKALANPKAKSCLIAMGTTSENVAERFGVTRAEQDQMGVDSNDKAIRAQKEGRFDAEIVPVHTQTLNDAGEATPIVVTRDDGPREGTTLAGLAKLKPAFKKEGTSTAGNSSQVSDGAAAVLLMTRAKAQELRLPILGIFRSYAVAGVPPEIMGIGPAEAIPAALRKAGLAVSDIDVFEINEAFASQAVYCVKKLGVPFAKLNPNGGAIALGHPLGCTGARQVATLMGELKRSRGRYGVISMCIGTGMGAAAVIEAE